MSWNLFLDDQHRGVEAKLAVKHVLNISTDLKSMLF